MQAISLNRGLSSPALQSFGRLVGSSDLKWLCLFEASFFVSYKCAMSLTQTAASPFWFPASLLLCAFLATPPRKWWLYVLAPLPIRALIAVPANLPAWFLAATWLGDSLAAVACAIVLRRLLENPIRFDKVNEFLVYLAVAVLAVPCLYAFAGAGARHLLGFPFWPAFQQWFFGNALTHLVLSTAILYWIFSAHAFWREVPWQQWLEAIAAGAGLILTGFLAFGPELVWNPKYTTLLYAPIPFLAWIAIRFGFQGTSAALTIVAVAAVLGAAGLRGPFASMDPRLNVLSIQLSLIVIGVPAFLLAALSGEKGRAEHSSRAANQALRESEARFRIVADAAPVLMWMAGVDKLCTFLNKPWLDFTGRTLEQEMGNGWAEGVHPEDLPACFKAYSDAFDARQPFLLHYRLRRHDGEYRWIEDNGIPRYYANGTFCGYVGTCQDVTPIKLAEQRFHLAIETSPNAIVLADQQGRIMLANRQTQQLFGYGDGELVGRSIENLVPKGFRDCNDFLATMPSKNNGKDHDLVARRKDGEAFQVAIALNPIQMDEEVLSFIRIQDITEKRRQEKALRQSEERMNMAAEAANLGMWVWDYSQPTIWGTDKFRQIFGFTPECEITPDSLVERIHPQDRQRVRLALQYATEKSGDHHVEYRLRLPDGTVRWIASHGWAEFDSESKVTRRLGVCIDITDRHRTEEEAQELSGRLISAQEDERSRLARDLHDEFSQSLALLAVDLDLLGQHPPQNAGAHRARIEALSGQVKALSLEAHRLSHELHPSKLEQLGLTAAIRSFCRDLQTSHNIAVAFDARGVPRNLPRAVALCLYRIAQEALQNVVKHSGATSAGVDLSCEGNEIRLSVFDNGSGFDIQSSQTKGSLGLVSMRERARLVRGQITWESKRGGGTRIEVQAPITAQADEGQMA